ncbi:receptor-type tyrosine-protein phosphatase S-like isoform X3 [Palaemon carinicauda]|uniref:receptor-type tyrosine-protein phosphatase S-like isoform X3 n=1 Tax=Palaemon carinicauda TaxID=392227 RepID=UPI0035B63232
MPLAMKDFLFLLGILWVIFLFPGTSAYPTWDPSSELPFVIYPMNERTVYRKDNITCNNSNKDNTMNLRRGVKCLSDDGATEVTVPLLHKSCRSPAKKLTVTVNREDDVVIEFRKPLNLTQMEWRHNQDPKKPYEKINMTDESKLIVPHDKTKESGVYLFKMDNNQPGASKECAVAIIRRECPANRYGAQCGLWCPDCMHGGVCDAKTGKCVCPPGFKGEWCEEACEGDQILNSCTINPGVTSNTQICLPSPYGCSCAPGKKGYWCNEDCDPGSWGVNCLQRCNHCVDGTCNTVTGKCSSGREDPCAGGPKGYLRFRQEPDVKPDEDKVTVTFVKEFDGEEPISKDIRYRVVIWEKDRSMNYMTTSKEVKDSKTATKMSVEIQGLAPATNYYAAVLVKFPLNGKVCKIDGTLRGERIQKKLFTTKCPKGKMSNIIQDWKSQEGFNISWKEEAYAKRCNYTYEVKVERVSDGEEIYNTILKNPYHSQDGLETYTEYRVSIAVVYEGKKSDPSITTIKTLPTRPTTPPSVEKIPEDSGSVTYKWNRPSDVDGSISYKYTYEVKHIACGEETEIPVDKETEATEVSFPKPQPYARVTFRMAIGNEAGFSGNKEISYETDPEVPAIKVEKVDCGDYKTQKQCSVTLENDCQKNNGRDLDIEAVWEYKTNSARDPKSGNIQAVYFTAQNMHDYIIEYPRDFYNFTTYQLAVYVKNEAGTNESSRRLSEKIITPAVAPGKVKITRNVSAHSSIDLGWDPAPSIPPTGDLKEYVIKVYKTQGKMLVGTFKTTNESYYIHNLDPDVSYTIHVSGINEGVEEPGEAAVTVIATVAHKPSQPTDFKQNSSLTDIVIRWNDHYDDKNFTLYYNLIFEKETYNISKTEHKFTGLEAEKTYPLQMKSCNQWRCSDILKKNISTDPWPPEIEGSIEVLDYSGNVSKMQLPRVKNPPALQYVVVVEVLENLNDTRTKQLALEVVEKYIEEEEENNSKHRMSKRSTTEREPEIWIAGKFSIENDTTKTVDVGTGEGENRPFQPEKNYNLVVVTEKKSGDNREFTVSDPVSTKGKAVASGMAGILFGLFIFVALIVLFAWTYKKRQTKVVTRTANQDRDCFLPTKEGSIRWKSSSLRKSTPNPDLLEQGPCCIEDEEIYSNIDRRIRFENIEPYLLKAIHSKETDMEFNSVPKVLEKSCSHSEHPENRLKNRYKNNLPYNDTRVRLPRLPQMPFSDYINANYIEGHLNPRAYIATQGPKDFNKDTTGDFWRMVWHTKSQMIIMIANVVENGKVKVAEYWPSEGTITKGGIDITLESTVTKMDFIIRTFILTNNEEIRKIQQYQFTTWPDHGVPESPYGVAQMIHSIRGDPLTGPIVVHCSAGIGRTGTILLVLGVMDQINNSGYMDIHEVLVKLRNGRPKLIENTAQYKFAHSVLREIYCEKQTRFTCQEFPEALLDLRVPQDNTNKSRIQQQFQELKQLPKDLSYKFAKRPEVSHLNRDPNILPPDSRMIYLQYTSSREESQYINAVSIHSMNGQVIVAEHPQRHTISRMWQMVYEKQISVWTLIHSFPVGDTEYPAVLPAECEENFDEFNVKVINHEDYDNFTEYQVTIRLLNSPNSAPFQCMVVLMKHWPHTNPNPSSLLPLLAVMERADSLVTASSAALFTCRDGVTGCGLMMALKQSIEKVKLHQEVDIYHSVQLITYDRPEFIVSEEQYDLVHEGVVVYLSAYSNYGNFN